MCSFSRGVVVLCLISLFVYTIYIIKFSEILNGWLSKACGVRSVFMLLVWSSYDESRFTVSQPKGLYHEIKDFCISKLKLLFFKDPLFSFISWKHQRFLFVIFVLLRRKEKITLEKTAVGGIQWKACFERDTTIFDCVIQAVRLRYIGSGVVLKNAGLVYYWVLIRTAYFQKNSKIFI